MKWGKLRGRLIRRQRWLSIREGCSIKRWLNDHGWHNYTINDNRRENDQSGSGGRDGSIWKEGRWYVDRDGSQLEVSWSHRPQWSASIDFKVGSSGLTWHIGLFGLSYWIKVKSDALARITTAILPGYWFKPNGGYGRDNHFDRPAPGRMKIAQSRSVGITWWGNFIHWRLWANDMESHPVRWRDMGIFPREIILGRAKVGRKKLGPPVRAWASFPEGSYPLILQRSAMRWKHPRWPFADVREYVDIEADVHNAPLIQGKGENSWDCGDDMILGMSSDGLSYEHAIAKYVESVLRDRARHGHVDPSHRAVVMA